MDDELDLKSREKLLDNEMRAFRNRGFHDGYDDGKKAVVQEAFDAGYQKAFEENFILSTLKGVAQALKTSYNLNKNNMNRPTSSTSTTSTSSSSTSSPLPSLPSTTNSSTTTSTIATSSSSSSSATNTNLTNISSNHIRILESMKFDNASDIDSIKQDLIKICRENRLDILAHYVSHIG